MSSKRKRSKIIGMAALSAAISFYAQAQVPGCTDSLALNFNQMAEVNDGSCTYGPLFTHSTTIVDPMSSAVRESSGLLFHENALWTINDSGNLPELYQLSSLDSTIVKTVAVNNATQIDWEALASDGTSIYIGDFGNNSGSRTDLRIYKIPWSVVLASEGDTTVSAEVISFEYPDQVDFTPQYDNNNFDCEAMFFYRDSLHLFSKNWVNNQTRHYRLPTLPGNHVAALIDSFNVQGLVTDAALNQGNDVAALLGYTETIQPFIYLLNDFKDGFPLSGNKRRIMLSGHGLHQTEGLTFSDSLTVFFTREAGADGPGLYQTDLSSVLYSTEEIASTDLGIEITRGNGMFTIIREHSARSVPIHIYDQLGRLLVNESFPINQTQFNLPDPLPRAAIVVSVIEGEVISKVLPPQFGRY